MKRKTFAGEWGLLGFTAFTADAVLLASQIYLEIIGHKSADRVSWAIVGTLTALTIWVALRCARYVRRHNAKVDAELRHLREIWAGATESQLPEHRGH